MNDTCTLWQIIQEQSIWHFRLTAFAGVENQHYSITELDRTTNEQGLVTYLKLGYTPGDGEESDFIVLLPALHNRRVPACPATYGNGGTDYGNLEIEIEFEFSDGATPVQCHGSGNLRKVVRTLNSATC
jgi:hypothetical protein